MRSSDFHDLVSGRRRGFGPAVLRAALATVEVPYRAGVWWRNRRYDHRPELTHRVSAPVVSVGNLTLGGSGKTPTVKWIVRTLLEHGALPAIVSRGYGAPEGGGPNDEALELAAALPGTLHLQNADRVAAAGEAVNRHDADVVVLDDGFQHRRLARDLDIVLLDATEPFGFGRVFPRGALREPVEALARADIVCLTRSDLVAPDQRERTRRRVAGLAPHALWCESVMAPARLIGAGGGAAQPGVSLEHVRGARVGLFCGLGNPAAFRRTAEAIGVDVAFAREFPDHHAYTEADAAALAVSARSAGADALLCTHKDLVKLPRGEVDGVPLWAVAVEKRLTVGENALRSRLVGLPPRVSRSA